MYRHGSAFNDIPAAWFGKERLRHSLPLCMARKGRLGLTPASSAVSDPCVHLAGPNGQSRKNGGYLRRGFPAVRRLTCLPIAAAYGRPS